MPLNRDQRPAIARRQDALLEGSLELIIVSNYEPIRLADRGEEFFRYWFIWGPDLHRRVVNGVADAKNFSGRIGGVAPGADIRQQQRAAAFDVSVQDGYGALAITRKKKRSPDRSGSP